jgi:glycosyltransferase involved in cell wall biosynthesis
VAPLVSIIIPCHNAAPWLAATLESALGQTWPEKEIILVDDGSTDDSLAIARSYEPRGVCVHTQPNGGASAARNTGLRETHGEYIQFLDADDLLAPDKIALQMALAESSAPDVVLCGTWKRFRNTPGDAVEVPEPLCADMAPLPWVALKFAQHAMMHPAAWLVSRALADRAGLWDESLSLDDDGEYFTRIVLASQAVRCCRGAVSYYRSGLLGSLSRRRSRIAWDSAWRSLELSVGRLLHVEDSPQTRLACATAFQQFIYDAFPAAPGLCQRATRRVAELGGCDLPPPMGPKTRAFARVFGWRNVWRMKYWFHR